MQNVTYLFGAGASGNALPIVSKIPDKLSEMLNYLSSLGKRGTFDEFKNLCIEKDVQLIQNEIIDACTLIIERLNRNQTVDDYARSLRLRFGNGGDKQSEREYAQLKVILSALFNYLEKDNYDIRYTGFVLRLQNDSLGQFYPNVNIVSWNYDMQFERCFSNISGKNDLNYIQDTLGLIPRHTERNILKSSSINLLKLNGSSTLHDITKRTLIPFLPDPFTWDDQTFLKSLIYKFAAAVYRPNEFRSNLNFAWEYNWNRLSEEVVTHACDLINRSSKVIVVGYSFPIYNREVDRRLFSEFSQNRSNQIIIQDPQPEVVRRNIQLGGILQDQKFSIELDSNVDSFRIPSDIC